MTPEYKEAHQNEKINEVVIQYISLDEMQRPAHEVCCNCCYYCD